MELKGVKLFVKRGDKPFSDGVVGHAKLLSSKTTLDERLREFQLWFIVVSLLMEQSSFPPGAPLEGVYERSHAPHGAVYV